MKTADLIFELGTEELPPLALKKLSQALLAGFVQGLQQAELSHGSAHAYASPRRLAVLIKDCAVQQPDRKIQKRGPAVQAAFDAQGQPTKAAIGFARANGVEVEQLGRLKTDKGEWLLFETEQQGQPATQLLPEIAAKALQQLPIPKRMRWGDSEAQFVRPVHWLLFKLGDQVVDCQLLDAQADQLTYGHRIHHPQPIAVQEPQQYAEYLEKQGWVIADFEQRQHKIKQQVEQAAASLGAQVMMDEALLEEVTALTEWPVAITGSFDADYLQVPAEALILTMKKNQKYFPLLDAQGKLLNHFITIANLDSPKPELIQQGNERVIRPRLADAQFFWQQDAKTKLIDRLPQLKQVIFQQKLGSMYDKTERVVHLSRWLAEQIGTDRQKTERAAWLSRCDLMTEMVGEFPEMQGTMGRYQALRDGEDAEIAQALEEFYLPRHAHDRLPQSPIGICIALAEKADSLLGIFAIGLKPSGDKDPFALRRAALGLIKTLRQHQLAIELTALLQQAAQGLQKQVPEVQDWIEAVEQFIWERLRALFLEEGGDVHVFTAVAAVKPRTIPDFMARIHAVQQFKQWEQAEALAAANKRIRNLLKKAGQVQANIDESLLQAPAEKALYQQLKQLQAEIQAQLKQADYIAVLQQLATLRPAVDQFFDQVMVMVEDQALKKNRLALLQQLQQSFMQVADISHLQ